MTREPVTLSHVMKVLKMQEPEAREWLKKNGVRGPVVPRKENGAFRVDLSDIREGQRAQFRTKK